MKKKCILKELILFLLLAIVGENLFSQTTYYWPGSGVWDAASAWATSSNGPATTTWAAGSIAQFDVEGTITGLGANSEPYSIIANQNVTVTGSTKLFGTPSGHKVASIFVAEGKTFDFGTQAFSTATGAGFVKNGKGALKFGSTGGGTYGGGFTLNEGEVLFGGADNSIGAGDLTINGGVLAASGTQSFSNSKLKSIVISADFTLGDVVNDKDISIGSIGSTAPTVTTMSIGTNAVRTITLAGAGVYTFMPAINGEGSSLVLNATSTGTVVLGGISTYNGGTTVNGAKLKLDAIGGALKAGSKLTVNGGLLHVMKSQVVGDFTMTAGELKIDAGQTLTILGEYNVTGGTIDNDGTIILSGTATQTFPGVSTVINNGIDTKMANLTINNPEKVVIDKSFKITGTLTINAGSKLTLSEGSKMTVANVVINSDEINGTGTIVDANANAGLTTTGVLAQQYLKTSRNWYISSPVTNATATSGANWYQYIEAGNNPNPVSPATANWATVSVGSVLVPMLGYVARSTADGSTIVFSGASLNSGDKSLTINRTSGVAKAGYNLVGNPYPSCLNIRSLASNPDIEPTYWIRTKNGAYVFDTYNVLGGIGTNNCGTYLTEIIPSGQAFWVRVKGDKSSATISFTNAMRSHSCNSTNVLRSPESANQKVLRLQITDGLNADETVLYSNANALDGLDNYDSPKMNDENTSNPKLYTAIGSEQLAINGLPVFVNNTEIALGFSTGATQSYSISAAEMSSFESNTRVILKDKLLNNETDITNGAVYSFNSGNENSTERFGIVFRSTTGTTNLNLDSDLNGQVKVYARNSRQITVSCGSLPINSGNIIVFDAIGRPIAKETISRSVTELNKEIKAGVYFIQLDIDGTVITRKLVVQ